MTQGVLRERGGGGVERTHEGLERKGCERV
jgi:hypothetical protein